MVPPKAGKCEFDVHGTEHGRDRVAVAQASPTRNGWTSLPGAWPLADLLSAVQVAYLRDVARVWPLPAQLRPLGPKQSRAYVMPDRSYEVDVSKLPTGELYVEMSHRVPAADAHRAKGCARRDARRAPVWRHARTNRGRPRTSLEADASLGS